jgi:hypothetical protein
MQIDSNKLNEKHDSEISTNRDSNSNVILPIRADAKHDLQSLSAFRGMQRSLKSQWEKHNSSIRFKQESDSNVNEAIFAWKKHEWQRISTERGMQIFCNEQ